MEFLILTGMSGAGKSQAAQIIEDIGYYCIDNIPAALIEHFVKIYTESPGKFEKVAFIIDIRGESEFFTLLQSISQLRQAEYSCRILFLDCADRVLQNRYKETRRVHPLTKSSNLPLSQAVAQERELLIPLRQAADYIIDTTPLTVSQLRGKLHHILLASETDGLIIHCVSFGFKYGILSDADLVFDVRCFPNPYWEAELRPLTGLDQPIKDYVMSAEVSRRFFQKLCEMLQMLLPLYLKEGKTQLTLGIGCTGGKHRSVVFAQAIKEFLCDKNYRAMCMHRDILKKSEYDK